jgi:Uma2 family endonuclease
MATTTELMTAEELFAIPENGLENWLIRGQLREQPMTRRNRCHAQVESKIAHWLWDWLERQMEPRGSVYSGEVGCVLSRNPDTAVGIDVAYVSAEMASRQSDPTTMLDGPPILAVEILSPYDKQHDINEKVEEYLKAGVALVWVVDPHWQTVCIHRQGAAPELVNATQELTGDPHLPGFKVPVARLFSR